MRSLPFDEAKFRASAAMKPARASSGEGLLGVERL